MPLVGFDTSYKFENHCSIIKKIVASLDCVAKNKKTMFCSAAKLVATGAGGLGFDYRRQRLHIAATFLRSCVAQARSRGDGPGYTLRCNTASIMKNLGFTFVAALTA